MSESTNRDNGLETFFAAARSARPEPSDDLMARILIDAEAARSGVREPAVVRVSRWRNLLHALGGWQAASGLATATLVGLWIGISPPAAVAGLAQGLLGEPMSVELSDQLPMFEDYLTEE